MIPATPRPPPPPHPHKANQTNHDQIMSIHRFLNLLSIFLCSCILCTSCVGPEHPYYRQQASGLTPWARYANIGRYQRVHQPSYVQRQQYMNSSPSGAQNQSGREPGERELEAIFGLMNSSEKYRPRSTQPNGPTCEICGEPAVVSGRWCGPHSAAIGQRVQERGY